ncbi:hypothetical protein EDB87DRAFT_1688319 [Lactarius vividus]|nr:hypothetical protein EDB87DRAFT_1688319 [Lactarius vividus]
MALRMASDRMKGGPGWCMTCMTPVLLAPDAQYVFINTRSAFLIDLSLPCSNVMVRLSTVFGFAFAATSVLIPGVLSQDVPACALACAQSVSDSSGCSLADTSCICTQTFLTAAGQCVGSQCTADEIQAAQSYFESLCGATGTSSSSSSSETSSTTETDTSTSTDVSSTISSSTTSSRPLTTATSSTTTTPRTTTTTSPSSTRTSSTSTTSSSSTPSNHATHDKPAGVLGAGLALGLALFAW